MASSSTHGHSHDDSATRDGSAGLGHNDCVADPSEPGLRSEQAGEPTERDPDDGEPLERLLLDAPAPGALGLADDASDQDIMAAAGLAASAWRGRANDLLTGVTETEVFEAAARTAESMYAAAQGRSTG